MKHIDLFFPPRRHEIELTVPSRVTEGKLWVRNLPFLIFIRVLSGMIADGLMRVPGLEKLLRGRYGIRHGGRADAPDLLKEARVRDGTRMGGHWRGDPEKTARISGGVLMGARLPAGIAASAGALKGGVLAGERLSAPDAERAARASAGTLLGGGVRGGIESAASVRNGTGMGGSVTVSTAARESSAAVSGGVRMGGSMAGGAVVVRLRKLAEMDGSTLAALDGQTLHELDYIVIEE